MPSIHIEKADEIIKKFETIITSDDYPNEAHDCSVIYVKDMIQESILLEKPIRQNYWQQILQELNTL
jgi:hypothetical protein